MGRQQYTLLSLEILCIKKGIKFSSLLFLLPIFFLSLFSFLQQVVLFGVSKVPIDISALIFIPLTLFFEFGIPLTIFPTIIGSAILAFWLNKNLRHGGISIKNIRSKSLITGTFIGCTIALVFLFLSTIGYRGFMFFYLPPLSEISNRALLGMTFISIIYGGVIGVLLGRELSNFINNK